MRERMEERFEMFYGLLKRSFEQTTFNEENYHYSYLELAFITLWSCLNDIQYEYFDKSDSTNQKSNGSFYQNWDLGTDFKSSLISKNNQLTFPFEDCFIKWKPHTNTHGVTNIRVFSKFRIDNFQFRTTESKNITPTEITIKYQIAFLLKNMEPIITNLAVTNANIRTKYNRWLNKIQIGSLENINSIRNKLYLTHGGDNNSYNGRLNGQITFNINDEIKPLFEIIYFLIMGKMITVDYN